MTILAVLDAAALATVLWLLIFRPWPHESAPTAVERFRAELVALEEAVGSGLLPVMTEMFHKSVGASVGPQSSSLGKLPDGPAARAGGPYDWAADGFGDAA